MIFKLSSFRCTIISTLHKTYKWALLFNVFHIASNYITCTKINTIFLHNIFYLFINPPTCFGLNCWPSSGASKVFSTWTFSLTYTLKIQFDSFLISGPKKIICQFHTSNTLSMGINPYTHWIGGTRWRSWFRPCAKPGRSRVRFPMVSLEFFINIILSAVLWPWDWLSL